MIKKKGDHNSPNLIVDDYYSQYHLIYFMDSKSRGKDGLLWYNWFCPGLCWMCGPYCIYVLEVCMTKTINKFGDEVDDYKTAYEWAKNYKVPEESDSSKRDNDQRSREFLECLGNGKSIYEIEAEEAEENEEEGEDAED